MDVAEDALDQERKLDLDLMVNEALKTNNEAVIEENIRVADPMYEKRIQKS